MTVDIEKLKELAEAAQDDPNSPYIRCQVAFNEAANPAAVLNLIAENEALRKALGECATSLEGEMLTKFGGQRPDEMHPVTRREYDRDMAEVAEYRSGTRGVEPDLDTPEIASLRKDAERYRYIRDEMPHADLGRATLGVISGAEYDEAIDADMSKDASHD